MNRARATRKRQLGIALALLASGAAVGEGQVEEGGVISVSLSADTVGLGDVFELRVTLRVPPRRVVYFPNSIVGVDGLESFRPVQWKAQPVEGEGADLTLTYRLIAFKVGIVSVPGFEVLTAPVADLGADGDGDGDRRGVLPGGSVVGARSDVGGVGGSDVSYGRSAIPSQRVWVASVLMLEDIAGGLEPRPPADIVGSSWDWSSLVPVLVLSVLLVVVLTVTVWGWLGVGDRRMETAGVDAASVDSPESCWLEALDELDRVLELGLHTQGRMHEFYTRSSGTVRTYIESLDPTWCSSLTSTELVARLEAQINGRASRGLRAAMWIAEIVKFGCLRPDRVAAEKHWRALRDWVHASRGLDW